MAREVVEGRGELPGIEEFVDFKFKRRGVITVWFLMHTAHRGVLVVTNRGKGKEGSGS